MYLTLYDFFYSSFHKMFPDIDKELIIAQEKWENVSCGHLNLHPRQKNLAYYLDLFFND